MQINYFGFIFGALLCLLIVISLLRSLIKKEPISSMLIGAGIVGFGFMLFYPFWTLPTFCVAPATDSTEKTNGQHSATSRL